VHGASAHGAVPSTNASSGDTQVTDVAANPAGTGPAGAAAGGPAEGPADGEELDAERSVVPAAGLADPAASGARTEPHPAMPTTTAAASTPAHRDVAMPTISSPLSTETPRRRFGWAGSS
jgi:hypothetical protein